MGIKHIDSLQRDTVYQRIGAGQVKMMRSRAPLPGGSTKLQGTSLEAPAKVSNMAATLTVWPAKHATITGFLPPVHHLFTMPLHYQHPTVLGPSHSLSKGSDS